MQPISHGIFKPAKQLHIHAAADSCRTNKSVRSNALYLIAQIGSGIRQARNFHIAGL